MAAFAIASLAHADSVMWTKVQPGLTARFVDSGTISLENAMVSVTYNVAVAEVDVHGNRIRALPSGSTISQGARVLYEFVPHKYSDISWVATGGSWDTPYGQWTSADVGDRCAPKNHYSDASWGWELFAALHVLPPSKAISVGAVNTSCEPQGDNKICVANDPGQMTTTFAFQPTTGAFFPGFTGDDPPPSPTCSAIESVDSLGRPTYTTPMQRGDNGTIFTMAVPTQTIRHTITVTAAPENPEAHAPSTPSLSSEGACVVGRSHAVSFVSSDPDGDNILYGIDWEADGSIDQFVPSPGYVPSGSPQTASRSYSMPGEKTVNVLAHDEGGLASPWATLTFSCTDSTTAGLDEGGARENSDVGQIDLPPAADLDLRIIPSLIRSGNTTKVNWSSTDMQSCTVTADNADAWTGLQSPIGGETSRPITGEITYILSCIDLDGTTHTKQATVRIIPTFQEL